jgi:uncharacterized membrane protein YdjX (TVP38/TMEM64 family)
MYLLHRGKFAKVVVCFLIERALFKQNLKRMLQKHPKIFKILRGISGVFKRAKQD